MAMASGTDPLDRLQAGARDLRAERERCHAAADRACRAESGEAFSTVMGRKFDDDTFVIQMDQELAAAVYFDQDLMDQVATAHSNPAMSADDRREAVTNILATCLQPWGRKVYYEMQKQVLAQVAAAYDK